VVAVPGLRLASAAVGDRNLYVVLLEGPPVHDTLTFAVGGVVK
jgi:hypothetical protein